MYTGDKKGTYIIKRVHFNFPASEVRVTWNDGQIIASLITYLGV